MKTRRLAVYFAICAMLMFLLPLYEANCQNYVTYSVQINSDGSALWKITSFSDINSSVDTLNVFQDKVTSIVNSAAIATHREMAADNNSLEINTDISSESKTTEYSFLWQNFSVIQGKQIVFGDVFQANNFFSQLYGDAALQVSYPASFVVKSVVPAPYQQDDIDKTLSWSRTQDLTSGKTNIVLSSVSVNDNSNQSSWQQYIIIVAIIAVAAALSIFSFYMLKRRKTKPKSSAAKLVLPEPQEIETEEGKLLKILKSSGGTMRQSSIVEQSRFSKAKTSQLLAILEKEGNITRYKKGRDKIVNLTERVKGEKK